MASQNGGLIRISMSDDGGTTYAEIAGALEDNATFAAEMIDGSTKDDGAWATFIDDVAMKKLTLSCSGKMVSGNTDLAEWWEAMGAGTTLRYMKFVVPDGRTYTGQFAMPSFENGAPHKGAGTFSATFESSGAITPSAS